MTNSSPRLWLLAFLTMLVGALFLPAGSAAASKWTLRTLPPQPIPLPPQSGPSGSGTTQVVLSGVSCPSESLCVAVGSLNTVAISQAPLGGADGWRIVNPRYDKPQQECLEEEGTTPEYCSLPRGALRAVSCSPESLCVAVGFEGSIYASTNPTGGADAWSVTDASQGDGTHLTAVSCPSASLCVAVSGGLGKGVGRVLTSTAPASGQWRVAQLGGSPDLRGVSCATPSLCVAVAKGGDVYVSTDPTRGASTWRRTPSPTPRDLFAVSCVAELLCAAGDAGGNILTSTDPTGGRRFAEINARGSVQIMGLTCPTTLNCVAVTNNADVLTSTDPAGPSGAWTFENLVPFEIDETGESSFVKNALFGASCPSITFCALVGANSRIFTATEPFAAPEPSRRASKRAKRPRTILVFAERFWKTTIARGRPVKARFRFYSPDGAGRFLCKPDRRRWRRCHSPLRYRVPVGGHVLRVRAIGRTGLRGPATQLRFKVLRPDRR